MSQHSAFQQNGDRHSGEIQPEQLTAYALGQLRGEELAEVESKLRESGSELAHCQVSETKRLASAIAAARNAEPPPNPSIELRAAVDRKLDKVATNEPFANVVHPLESTRRWRRPTVVEYVVIGGICCVLLGMLFPAVQARREAARRVAAANDLKQLSEELKNERANRVGSIAGGQERGQADHGLRYQNSGTSPADVTSDDPSTAFEWHTRPRDSRAGGGESTEAAPVASTAIPAADFSGNGVSLDVVQRQSIEQRNDPLSAAATGPAGQPGATELHAVRPPVAESLSPDGSRRIVRTSPAPMISRTPGNGGMIAGDGAGTAGGAYGGYGNSPGGMPGGGRAMGVGGSGGGGIMPGGVSGPGRGPGMGAGGPGPIAAARTPATQSELKFFYEPAYDRFGEVEAEARAAQQAVRESVAEHSGIAGYGLREYIHGGEQYLPIVENAFLAPTAHPLSTFSIDVDTASYANVRRFLTGGQLPPPNAVRIEELINYFSYSYPQPKGPDPFSVNMETAECPWNAGHLLLRVGLKGKEIHRSERPPSNLTFLLDVSGSMADENKLPLLKTTLMMFVAELTENDRVSIVTYAGDAGLRLPPTHGNEKAKIMAAIESLSAGGSTHGSAGIQLAYEQAGQYFLKEGTNRVILATDGDLNVGITSDDALVELIKAKAAGGTFLTVLGFGTGNLKDGKLERLADNGNGVYAYIDGVREGRKMLVEQMSGSLVAIAKDVKIQIEFNPREIASYRLLGYENRVLAAADFNNDKKDAGEIGAGHTVTALYELAPVGAGQVAAPAPGVDALRYQEVGGRRSEVGGQSEARLTEAAGSGELLTLKLRYKEPDGQASKLLEVPHKSRGGPFNAASKDLQFAAAVASFGMILRGSEHRGSGNLPAVAEIASGAIGDDPNGYRAEFVDLVRKAHALGAK